LVRTPQATGGVGYNRVDIYFQLTREKIFARQLASHIANTCMGSQRAAA